MPNIRISPEIGAVVPDFKIGAIEYHEIAIGESPKKLKTKLDYIQEELKLQLEEKTIAQFSGIRQWREVFKKLGTDPGRYRPSHEALYRRVKKGGRLPSIHSAADMNNFFSLQYEIPLGIYDLDQIGKTVTLRVGTADDAYEGLNGRMMNMAQKLLSSDENGAFGSPIVDSKKTMTTEKTTSCLQLIYFTPATTIDEAEEILAEIKKAFLHIHGGHANAKVITV